MKTGFLGTVMVSSCCVNAHRLDQNQDMINKLRQFDEQQQSVIYNVEVPFPFSQHQIQ